MPTPHIDCPRAKSDMTPCVLRDGELAADDRGCCVGCGERIGPQTGGGDAPKCDHHWIAGNDGPFCTKCGEEGSRAQGQTAGSDAGELERAREIATAWCLEACREAAAGVIFFALRSSHREGAEAMREECAKAARGPGGHDECDHGAGYMDGRLDAAFAIEALPIPGRN